MSKENLQNELNSILGEIKNVLDRDQKTSSRLESLDAQYLEVKSALDSLDQKMASPRYSAPSGTRLVKAGDAIADQLLASEDFNNFVHRKGGYSHAAASLGILTEFNTPFERKAAVGNAEYQLGETSTQSDDVRRVIGVTNEQRIDREDQRILNVWDILPKRSGASHIEQWVQEVSRTKDAQGTAEGQLKPDSSFEVATRNSTSVTIPTFSKVSRQLLHDVQETREFVRDILMNAVAEHLEDQVLYGDGDTDAGNLQGLMVISGIQQQAFLTNIYDTIRSGIRMLAKDNRVPPTHVIVNHDEHFTMDTLKSAEDGHYLWVDSGSNALGGGVQTVWRVPVVPTNSIESGRGLLGNFALGCQVREVEPMSMMMSYYDQDDFIRNMVTFLAECRLHFICKRPQRFVRLGLISGY